MTLLVHLALAVNRTLRIGSALQCLSKTNDLIWHGYLIPFCSSLLLCYLLFKYIYSVICAALIIAMFSRLYATMFTLGLNSITSTLITVRFIKPCFTRTVACHHYPPHHNNTTSATARTHYSYLNTTHTYLIVAS